jgi:hypothetical protein
MPVNKHVARIVLMWVALTLAACQSHPELRYSPEEYAKLRGIELVTTEPTRHFELVATVQGFGGQHTSTNTMINSMIDEAHNSGAFALIPMDFTGEGRHKGQTKPVTGLDLFVYSEGDHNVTKGRAIRWIDD